MQVRERNQSFTLPLSKVLFLSKKRNSQLQKELLVRRVTRDIGTRLLAPRLKLLKERTDASLPPRNSQSRTPIPAGTRLWVLGNIAFQAL